MSNFIECSATCLDGRKCTQPATKRSDYKYCRKHEGHYRRAEKASQAKTGKPAHFNSTVQTAMERFVKDPHIHNLRSELGVLRSMLNDLIKKENLTITEKKFVNTLVTNIAKVTQLSQELEEKQGYLINIVYLSAMLEQVVGIIKKYVASPETQAAIAREIKELPWKEIRPLDDAVNRYEEVTPALKNPQMNIERVDLDMEDENES